MAVVTKKFVAKHGLKVEGTEGLEVTSATATVGTFDVLTKKQADQDYIVGLIGGTSTSANTPDSVVKRDENGDFAAGTITADLTGNADTATALETARTIELTGDVTGSVSFDGTANVQISSTIAGISGDAVGTTDTQTLTNKTISGTDNTITDIANGSLVNDSITINGNATALGGSVTLDTGDIQEDGNLYFTDTRARDAVSAGSGLEYNSSTGEFAADLGFGLQFDGNSQISVDGTVIATDQDVTDAFTAHNVSSGVHGVTGNIVGTTDTQTLSNKTLGDDLDADGNTVTNLAQPFNASDAATKGYVDAVAEGLHVHASVVAATTESISLTGLSGAPIIDGFQTSFEDRVLVKDQTSLSENGIYVVEEKDGAWSLKRAFDYDTAAEIQAGDFVFVSGGNTYASTGWVQENAVATLGTDPIVWDQFSGAGTFTAGNGLTLTGTEFAIDTGVTATRQFVTDEVGDHNDLTTGVHGVTGNVVGTTDSQTLTNKTLGSGNSLSANLDAVNTHTIVNLADPSGDKDAATKKYVDDSVSGAVGSIDTDDVPEAPTDPVNLYFTDARAKTSAADLLTNATLSNIIITGDGSGLIITAENGVADSDTDDLAEGFNNLYFTDERAQDAVAAAIAAGTHENIVITYDDNANSISFVAENGVADSTTNDLVEGTDNSVNGGNNLYFTDARAVSALEAVVPNFTEIDINEVATQVASASSGNASEQVTAYAFSKDSYRSAKFLVKVAYGTHTEVSEVLLTLDTSDNIAITEYAVIGTNGSASTISAGINGTSVELYVTPVNNTSTIKVMGTLLV